MQLPTVRGMEHCHKSFALRGEKSAQVSRECDEANDACEREPRVNSKDERKVRIIPAASLMSFRKLHYVAKLDREIGERSSKILVSGVIRDLSKVQKRLS